MLTKSTIQFLRTLHHKQMRQEQQLFIAEGIKVITELTPYFTLRTIYVTSEHLFPDLHPILITEQELKKISCLTTPQKAFAVFEKKTPLLPHPFPSHKWILALDHIADPGNLGTIIRIADWYGIDHILCSQDCVEVWNPKVVQATMGSLGRVQVHYGDLLDFFSHTNLPIVATSLQGSTLDALPHMNAGILLMGNESQGISELIQQHSTYHIKLPSFPHDHSESGAESLNVAVATAICTHLFVTKSHGA